jgi:isopentenyl-diphosphate delta-isomerase type 1
MITTDNQNEIFDVVDTNDWVIGKATRGEVHKDKNLIHRSIGVAVFNSKGDLFLQQRSKTKDMDPLYWDISVGGHVRSGMDYVTTALREIEEELGIHTYIHVVPYMKYLCRTPHETEMVTLFKMDHDGPFKLDTTEIKQGRFFTREEFQEEISTQKIKLNIWGKMALQKLKWF